MGRRILLADDEAYVTSVISHKLQQLGDEVLVASDGQEGFDLACAHRPELIVTDFQMPVLSGYEMAVKLKQTEATSCTPILMLTARGHLLSPEELASANIQSMLSKPFSSKALLAQIEELIGPPRAAA
jgi:two-component system alkaline phosphatase synthesis response regulator PhoP